MNNNKGNTMRATTRHSREAYSTGYELAMSVGRDLGMDELVERHEHAVHYHRILIHEDDRVKARMVAGRVDAYADLIVLAHDHH
jgi:hypothetical protein